MQIMENSIDIYLYFSYGSLFEDRRGEGLRFNVTLNC